MVEERILAAVERIDDAMARIEAAAARPAIPLSPAPDAALRERHEAMRGRVEAAIAELDALIRNG